ncbi:DUF2933 domain-containing protein [Tahibacter amnicola]|uniref:DUF2933 domain-containing protein n=1 Tax=Tahibacter amnicola TaxID=2976241 RepID=A0ABY6B7J4_9GAMM|nr:DUF2933 domain-containing protein [Tahibacter amnicola]UXI66066.1 DUF2933 domain-containing protein [Tahibacter amnicola]
MNRPHETHGSPRLLRWAFWGFAAIAGFFLVTEHGAHLLGVLPYLLILACPLMHIFGHHGHSHEHDQEPPDQPPASNDQAASEERRNSRAGHHHH